MTQHTFLVEIGTEELPPKSLRSLSESFATHIRVKLDAANFFYDEISWFATPRRLAVKVTMLRSEQSNSKIKKCGSTIEQTFKEKDIPQKAAKILVQSCDITINQSENLTTNRREQSVYDFHKEKQLMKKLLYTIVKDALKKLPIKKTMRWSDTDIQFIRPVHTVTLLLDNTVITGNILGIDIDRIVLGHRFMGQWKIRLEHADQYPQILLDRGMVIADYWKRKEIIRKNTEAAAKQLGGLADLNESLLEEVTSLVEWPVLFSAHFKEKFLVLPPEVLIYILKEQQKYFPIYDTSKNLLPYFIFVANIESKDSKSIITGNEKVIHSRLADAEFFFNIDRKKRLEDRLPLLDTVLFQKQLGTLREKSDRIKALSAWIAWKIGADVFQVSRASLLSKCDLMTNMVFEFTGIQGVIGMYYAKQDGEPEAVALAQKEQYLPRFSGDILPTTLVSCAVAIADKMDTLTGIFGINQFPKGNRDPFALRRAAIGILRIIIDKKLPLDLQTLTEVSVRAYGKKLINNTVINDVVKFMLGRFCFWYKEQGHSIDTIQSVLARRPTLPVDFDARVRAVSYFRTMKEAASLAAANKRVSNILAKSSDPIYEDRLASYMFKDPAEITLATHLNFLNKKIQPLLESVRYKEVLIELATLREPIDIFFDKVRIMVDNPELRINRLTLLAKLRELFLKVADISLLQIR